jgi:hypothetical protein
MAKLRSISLFKTSLVFFVLFLFVFFAELLHSEQLSAKHHFKKAEALLKQNDVYQAYEHFNEASKLDPGNKKYSKKLVDVAKMASTRAEGEGRSLLNSAPQDAEQWLRRALQYDNANAGAAQALSTIQQNVQSAREKASKAQAALNSGDLRLAEDLVESIRTYHWAIPSTLPTEISLAKRALLAEDFWKQGQTEKAIEELSYTDAIPNSVNLVNQISSELFDAITFQGTERSNHMNGRISLELLKFVDEKLKNHPRYQEEAARSKAQAYPALRVRVFLGDIENCTSAVGPTAIMDSIKQAIGDIGQINDTQWDITLNVRSTNCSSNDVPRRATQNVNSTYVAGYTQLVNPEYVRLEGMLGPARQSLYRAQADNQSNPSFETGFRVGYWNAEVSKIQQAMASTPPFLNQEVLQQYQYEKYEAYQSFSIESNLQIQRRHLGRATAG